MDARAAGRLVVALALTILWSMTVDAGDTYSTTIGEQRSVELPDGARIHLDAQSRVSVQYSSQALDVYLSEGQGLFQAPASPTWRPFRVHTHAAVIDGSGAEFNIRIYADRTKLVVIRGKTLVSMNDIATRAVAAGEEADIDHGGFQYSSNVDTRIATAWRERRLWLEHETLQSIITEFNRYNRRPKIRVEGSALRGLRFNGVLDVDSPESFLMCLTRDGTVAIMRNSDEIVLRPVRN